MESRSHYHPLNPNHICCAQHACEMLQVYEKQEKSEEAVTTLVNFSASVDTKFLLDSSESSVSTKWLLGDACNSYAVSKICHRDFITAKLLLQSSETLLNSMERTAETLGLLATVYHNTAYACKELGELNEAYKCVENAGRLEKKANNPIGNVTTWLNKSAVLIELGAYQEAYSLAKSCLRLIQPRVNQMLKSTLESELVKNQRFQEEMTLVCIAYSHKIHALESLDGKSYSKKAAKSRTHAQQLARRFLGEDHPMSLQLLKASTKKDFRIRSHISSLNSSIENFQKKDYEVLSSVFVTKPQEPTKFIRMPGSNYPQIPHRPSFKRDLLSYKPKPVNYYENRCLIEPGNCYFDTESGQEIGQLVLHEGNLYLMQCSITLEDNQPHIMITVYDKNSPITKKYFPLVNFAEIVNLIRVEEILPNWVNIKFINSFEKFAQYFLFPFMKIINISESPKIELWAKSPGILQTNSSFLFLDTECKLTVCYLEHKVLRAVLSSAENEDSENSVLVDLVFDESSSETMFGLPVYPSATFKCLSAIQELPQELITHLQPFIASLEHCARNHLGIQSFQEFVDSNSILGIRSAFSENSPEKVLWVVSDCPKQRHWLVRALKPEEPGDPACFKYTYLRIIQNFGLKVNKLSKEQKKLLAYYLLESLNLEQDEEEKVIMPTPISSLLSTRFFLNRGYQVPVTLSLIGVKSTLIGVKVTLYNLETCLDLGCLLSLDGDFYLKDPQKVYEDKKKHKLKSFLSEETTLEQILESQNGWNAIIRRLQISKSKVHLVDLLGQKSYLDSLENVLFKYK
mgnify:CR=1 FL=1